LGEDCGWIPNLPLRTAFGDWNHEGCQLAYLNREWELTAGGLIHRSGIRIQVSGIKSAALRKSRVVVGQSADFQVIPSETEHLVRDYYLDRADQIFQKYAKAYCGDYRPLVS
jgi:hypothetical protein